MQPSEEFEQNNFDRIQCALDIVHIIDELESPCSLEVPLLKIPLNGFWKQRANSTTPTGAA